MQEWPRIILLGDSITQYSFGPCGWGAHVADLVQRKCDVLNRGFSGYTTQYLIQILEDIVDAKLVKDVAAVTIFYGANDSSLMEFNERQHVPVARYQDNMGRIIERFIELGVNSDEIIVISPPPVDEKAWMAENVRKGRGNYSDRSNLVVDNYVKACHKISETKKCRFINLFDEMMSNKNYSHYLSDGLHLSDEGNRFLGKLLEKHVLELTDELPTILPLWADFPLEQ